MVTAIANGIVTAMLQPTMAQDIGYNRHCHI